MEKKGYCYKFPRPSVTADCIVLRFNTKTEGVEVLLIQRKAAPFKDLWAFPGGFVNENEDLLTAAERELAEETQLKGVEFSALPPVGTPLRDPRGHVITCPFIGGIKFKASGKLKASDDAKALKWFPVDKPPKLAFDHNLILINALSQSRHVIIPQMMGNKATEYNKATAMKSMLRAIYNFKA